MKLFNLKSAAIGSIVGLFLLLGAAGTASAQVYNKEYRDWQAAQQRAQREYHQYLRTRKASDYRDWQKAQLRAQREYADYQRSVAYNNRYYNDRYTNRAGGSTYYRINRGGRYYQTDARGAELLRQAVNSGYQQGFQQGQIDSRYGRRANYTVNNVYRSGTYGYQTYVDRSQYQYYFQQGFQRGYQDGFSNQYRYGYRSNNGLSILGTILNGILNISQN